MNDWIKLSDAEYSPGGVASLTGTMKPGLLAPELPIIRAEHELADRLGVDPAHVMLTNSCTAALSLAYHFLSQGGQLAVEAPVLTWPSSYSYAPNKNLVDTDAAGWPAWSDRSDVVRVVVSLWGRHPPVHVLQSAAGVRTAQELPRSPVILDAAHYFGSGLDELAAGRVAAVAYSFGPAKEVPAVRGGALISPLINETWRAFANSGVIGRYGIYPLGGNYRMAEPFAALLIAQLTHFKAWKERREEILEYYAEHLDVPLLTHPGEVSGHLAVIQAKSEDDRNRIVGRLLDNEIQYGVHYQVPAWMPAALVPKAWYLSRTIISLPCHTHLLTPDLERVVKAVAG